jgi:hypothetical protein
MVCSVSAGGMYSNCKYPVSQDLFLKGLPGWIFSNHLTLAKMSKFICLTVKESYNFVSSVSYFCALSLDGTIPSKLGEIENIQAIQLEKNR